MTHSNRIVAQGFFAFIISLALLSVSVQAQESTEQFIPIGYSPGVSGKYSYVGKITALDPVAHTITVGDGDQSHVIKVSDATRIWLDRSKVKRENTEGDYEDCEVGRLIEVMYFYERKDTARWIKIESR